MKKPSFLSSLLPRKRQHETDLSSDSNKPKKTEDESILSANQRATVLRHLKSGWTLTQIDAAKQYNIWRLGARIWELRDKGYSIRTIWQTKGKRRIAVYQLVTS